MMIFALEFFKRSKPEMFLIFILEILTRPVLGSNDYWNEWWAYDGVSGPRQWGIYNPDWHLCDKGKLQSPINILPEMLVYDPFLSPIEISNVKANGLLKNTGRDLQFVLNKSTNPFINITGGPLSYRYEMYEVKVHFGTEDRIGSEHQVANKSFPIEIQVYGFNSEIYANLSKAKHSPYGLIAISILTMISDRGNSNKHFNDFVRHAERVKSKGQSQDVYGFSLWELLPDIDEYMTYEGSLTQPGCLETVTWIILNKPMNISRRQLNVLRTLTHGDGSGNPLMENNFRPIMPTNGRFIRTNIKVNQDPACEIKQISSYNVNSKYIS